MKVALLLPSFDAGGAQRQFAQLARGLADRGHAVLCIALVPGGPYWRELESDPLLRVVALHERAVPGRTALGRQWLSSTGRLAGLLDRERPDILYSALHIANLLGWLATRGGRRVPLVWGLRAARQDLPWRRRLPYMACAALSPWIDLLIANSATGLADHRASAYRTARSMVVPNGIDTEAFRPDAGARRRVRAEWAVPDGTTLVGMIGRLVAVKDHSTFLRAARLVVERSDVRLVCVGSGTPDSRARLEREAAGLGLGARLLWAGERADMPAVCNALDILCLPSRSEAFPNALAEAMACGVPCVATAVGDVPAILGEHGRLVPVGEPSALALALHAMVQMPVPLRQALGLAGRGRICRRYAIGRMVEASERALAETVARRADLAGRKVPPSLLADRKEAP